MKIAEYGEESWGLGVTGTERMGATTTAFTSSEDNCFLDCLLPTTALEDLKYVHGIFSPHFTSLFSTWHTGLINTV